MDESEGRYNGWTNYETWVVRLWLDNEEPSYRYWTGEARKWHGQEGAANRLAEQLKDELSEASPVNEPTVYGDLMNAALGEVNWLEIAESYLDEVEPSEEKPDEGEQGTQGGRAEPVDLSALCDLAFSPKVTSEFPELAAYSASVFQTLFPERACEVISTYTRSQALADGVLIDVTDTAREAGFRIPVALTSAVWAEYVSIPEGVEGQDEAGRLWDILWMCRFGVSQPGNLDASEVLFQLHIRNDNRAGDSPLVCLKAVCGPNDDASPCITIMKPDED